MGGQNNGHLIYGIGHSSKTKPIVIHGEKVKEYETWRGILKRCHDEQYLLKEPTYNGCIVSDDWLYYDNFYLWIIRQENYEKWKQGGRKWAIDKDIKHKGNKIYSADTCLLVPQNVNSLFTNRKLHRGNYPIGVDYFAKLDKFRASCMNPFTGKQEYIGVFDSIDNAFKAYKKYKECIIHQVAEIEYCNRNITKECYLAMLKYQVEIDD